MNQQNALTLWMFVDLLKPGFPRPQVPELIPGFLKNDHRHL